MMKTIYSLGIAFAALLSFSVQAQNIEGAWKLTRENDMQPNGEVIRIYADGYFMFGKHQSGSFSNAGGGSFSIKGKELTEVLDFHTENTDLIRKLQSFKYSVKGDELTIEGSGLKQVWKKVDDGKTKVTGAWRFGARVNDEGVAGERRGAQSPRQTMKILSGKHFQWAAFNYETKEFSGTGGGTYELNDGKYTETIRFFSRDNSRAGMSLTFDCRVDGSDWYHKGKGTTGNPVSEVWEKIR